MLKFYVNYHLQDHLSTTSSHDNSWCWCRILYAYLVSLGAVCTQAQQRAHTNVYLFECNFSLMLVFFHAWLFQIKSRPIQVKIYNTEIARVPSPAWSILYANKTRYIAPAVANPEPKTPVAVCSVPCNNFKESLQGLDMDFMTPIPFSHLYHLLVSRNNTLLVGHRRTLFHQPFMPNFHFLVATWAAWL